MSSLSDCKNYEYPSPSSSSASFIVSNVDMLTQILLRLPAKSLLIFKSVSKQWFSLISDPFFTNKYNILQNALSIQRLFAQTWASGVVKKLEYIPLDGSSSSSAPFQTLSFISNSSSLSIVQSCNGLMCCKKGCEIRTYYVCNPSTRQYRKIVCESQKYEKRFGKLSSVSIAYDPLKSPHYKVVCIWLVTELGEKKKKFQIEIYSSETASWKLSGEFFSKPDRFYSDIGVFWNGSLHWIVKANRLFYFNVDRELGTEMETEFYDKGLGLKTDYFGECKGHLYLIRSRKSSPTNLEILEMKTDYTGWNTIYLVNLQELEYPGFEFNVLLVKESEGESPKLLLRIRDKAISCDLQDTSFKEIQQLAPGPREFVGYAQYLNKKNLGYPYIQSLACV